MERKKVVLLIIDGWGHNKEKIKYDAIRNADTRWYNTLKEKYPSFLLYAHGTHVGLPDGLMGNSEVGHLTIGSGRVIEQDIIRINREIEQDTFKDRLKSLDAYKNQRLHIIGLLSDGGVHSHINHIKALVKNVPNTDVLIHAISDGRDTDMKSFMKYYNEFNDFCSEIKKGKIVSVSGRFYAMDRDKNDDRTSMTFRVLTNKRNYYPTIEEYIERKYKMNDFDEHIDPQVLFEDGYILKGEPIVFANYRADRMRQIVMKFDLINPCFSMTEYDKKLKVTPIFEKRYANNCLTEVFSNNEISNLHLAETEKYAHVTYFFNGGREEEFKHEKRVLINSPKVTTYDQKPEMSTFLILESALRGMNNKYGLIVINFAAPDMVGHTGNYEKTCDAVLVVDECIGLLYEGCKNYGYTLFITADHGNAETMANEKNVKVTTHTTNKVPFIICDGVNKLGDFDDGEYSLKDVAPTILSYMNIEIPNEMTGKDLLKEYEQFQ